MDYSYIREKFDINSIAKSILSIQVSLDGFSFVINPVDSDQGPDYIYINRIEIRNSENLISQLSSFTGFDLKEFYAIRIIANEPYFTLIPESIFDLQDMKAYLNLNHPPRLKSKAVSTRISYASAVCVFSMEQELYDLLKFKFPGADFCHTSLPFCKYALGNNTDGCYIQCYEKSMELVIVKDNKLALYNIFETHNEKDILYFILNAYKSINIDPHIHPLHVAGILEPDSELLKLASKYLKDIRFYSSNDVIIQEKEDFHYPSHYFLNHREILNCEL